MAPRWCARVGTQIMPSYRHPEGRAGVGTRPLLTAGDGDVSLVGTPSVRVQNVAPHGVV